MSAMSDYLETAILNHIFRNTAIFSTPTTLYLSLHTANPADDASGTEVSTTSTGYARKSITTTGGTAFEVPADDGSGSMQTSNDAVVTFATPSASWGDVTHFGIWTASTGGNLLFYGALDAQKTIGTSDTVQFAANQLVIKLN